MISPDALLHAAETVSSEGRFFFTRKNLFYELIRESAIVGSEPEDFEGLLDAHEARHGRLEKLIRPEEAPQSFDLAGLSRDVTEFAVPRALVFERVEPMLCFVLNGFHRRIETALLAEPSYPEHVWGLLRRQLASGFSTRFFAVHDATAAGYDFGERLGEVLSLGSTATIIDLGLNMPWAFQLRLPLRSGPAVTMPTSVRVADRVLLEKGRYVEFEAMAPRRAMQWVYDRIADEAEEIGFG